MNAEAEAVGLAGPVIRILTDDHDFHVLERSELEGVEDIRTWRINLTGPIFFQDRLVQFSVIGFCKFPVESFLPLTSYRHCIISFCHRFIQVAAYTTLTRRAASCDTS